MSSLEVSGLTKQFGGVKAVDDVSFSIRSGTVPNASVPLAVQSASPIAANGASRIVSAASPTIGPVGITLRMRP